MMNNNGIHRKKDSARIVWDSKPRRAPNPKDIEFQTAEVVIPNPETAGQLPMSFRDKLLGEEELDKQKMNRLIAPNGSIYVHLDWHVGHYVKVMMDEIFGKDNFRNEIVWRYRRWPAPSHDFQKTHDTIYRYTKEDNFVWNQLF